MTSRVDEKTARSQAKLAASAGRLEESASEQTESADRRTELAADRTVLAAERTYAAWIRTGLGALASGVGAKALLEEHISDWLISSTSIVLTVFAIFCFVAGVWRQIEPGAPPPRPDVRSLPSWLLIVFNGFLIALCIAILIGFLAR